MKQSSELVSRIGPPVTVAAFVLVFVAFVLGNMEEALKVASQITHPVAALVSALVIAATVSATAIKAKKTRLAWVLAIIIVLPGLAPLAAFTFVQIRGVYRIRVVVLGLDGQPVQNSELTSTGGEIKKASGYSEIDVSPQTRPADSKLFLYASVKNSFLAGSYTLVLGGDYYPTATIQLAPLPEVLFRGSVRDEYGRRVAGAHVSISGYQDIATTNEMGNFELPAHAADGQMVTVHAEKGGAVADISVPTGAPAELVIRTR